MSKSKNLLPVFYNDNMVGFFSQSPTRIYVYWELSAGQWQTVAEMKGLIIRLYRVRENENSEYEYIPVREINPPPYTGSWYFDGLDPETRYCLEVGGKLSDGSFFPLVKSRIASTPPIPKLDALPRRQKDNGVPAEKGRAHEYTVPHLVKMAEKLEIDDVLKSMPFYMGYHI